MPWMKILLGFSPLEVLNSPTIAPMLAIKPSLYFQVDILGSDCLSMTISEANMSKFS